MNEADAYSIEFTPGKNNGSVINMSSGSAFAHGNHATCGSDRERGNAVVSSVASEQIEKFHEHIQDLQARCAARQEQIDEVRFFIHGSCWNVWSRTVTSFLIS